MKQLDGVLVSEGAEDRSITLLEHAVDSSKLDDRLKRTYKEIGIRIIDGTRWTNDPVSDPLGHYAEVVDQIGSANFREDDGWQLGLLYEMQEENKEATVRPHRFINFEHVRSHQLLTETEREQVIRIFGEPQKQILGLSDEPVAVSELISKLESGEIPHSRQSH